MAEKKEKRKRIVEEKIQRKQKEFCRDGWNCDHINLMAIYLRKSRQCRQLRTSCYRSPSLLRAVAFLRYTRVPARQAVLLPHFCLLLRLLLQKFFYFFHYSRQLLV